MQSRNNQIQADKFASEGFLVIMPDVFDGDYAPNSSTTADETDHTVIEQIKLGIADVVKSFNLDMWIARQTPEKVLPIIYKVLEGAREEFADAVASGGGIYGVGYCLGGKFLLQLASEKPIIFSGAQKVIDEEVFRMINFSRKIFSMKEKGTSKSTVSSMRSRYFRGFRTVSSISSSAALADQDLTRLRCYWAI